MVNINKSFLYGICLASITWTFSIYLYINLVRNTQNNFNISKYNENINFPKKTVYMNSLKTIEDLKPIVQTYHNNIDEFGLIKTPEDKAIRDDGYKRYAFNILISNQISYNRTIPDTRNDLCKNVTYPSNLPKASIVICFYNEHNNTLIRTIVSIINRTPKELLKEIILVDDFSDIPDLHKQIENYINQNFDSSKIKLIKTSKREGLIRARILGAENSKGEVLIFLDSHIEVNVAWIEPLLVRIKENRKFVATPIIDIINADTFSYSFSPLVRGGFNWGLHFKWENLPKGILSKKEDFIKPIKSPTMAGGLFAINRKYFFEIGKYDDGMNIWGGENLELSFRIWMCGGHLDIIPCSRVGHVFRQRRPYGSPNGEDTMLRNSLRVAYVWLDDYRQYFLNQRPDSKAIDFGDISTRLQLRKQLKCNDFNWYLKNVYPELTLPTDDQARLKKKWSVLERDKFQPWNLRKRNYIDHYQIRLSNSSLCIQSEKDTKTKGDNLILRKCQKKKNQIWYETDKSELVLGKLLCLQSSKPNPILYKCHEMGSDQEWKHKGTLHLPIYNIAAGTCLGVKDKQINALVILKICSDNDFIYWDIIR